MVKKYTKQELKQKGKRLLKDGCALVDTSGRTKQIKEKSVLALASKSINFTVLMFSSEKKKVLNKLMKRNTQQRAFAIMHSVKLYYALKDYVEILPAFYICCDGFDRGLLKYYLRSFLNIKYHDKKINIEMSLKPLFGKRNIADRLGKKVNKEGKPPTMILNEKHFKDLNLI